jgi:hypothetical protein
MLPADRMPPVLKGGLKQIVAAILQLQVALAEQNKGIFLLL